MAASHPMGGVNAPRPFSLLLNLEARLTLSLSFGWLGDGWWWEGGWQIRPSCEAAITPEAAGYPACESAPGDAGPERVGVLERGEQRGSRRRGAQPGRGRRSFGSTRVGACKARNAANPTGKKSTVVVLHVPLGTSPGFGKSFVRSRVCGRHRDGPRLAALQGGAQVCETSRAILRPLEVHSFRPQRPVHRAVGNDAVDQPDRVTKLVHDLGNEAAQQQRRGVLGGVLRAQAEPRHDPASSAQVRDAEYVSE